ncbi:MAG: hypothetical protein QXH64_03775 [Nitrososphaeria archaeon]
MIRRKRKGQLLIFAGIILTLLIFYIAITVHVTSTSYQNLRYEEVKEIVDNFNEDFRRALKYILASMTQEYNATAEMDTPRYNSFERFTLWMKTAIRTFSARGIQVNFTFNKVLLQPQKLLFGKLRIPERYVYDLAKLYWYSPQSISAISANFSLNVPGSGFYGWKGQMLILLNMTVYVDSIENDNKLGTKVTVSLNKEYGEPVEDLTAKNFRILYFDKSTSKWENAKIVVLLNNGGGNYTIYFKSISDKIIDEPYNRYIMVSVIDNREIIVESYTYTAVEYVIQENAVNQFYPNTPKPEEVYSLEVILNGTILWFNRQLAFSGTYPPIPMPPVKQFRVYSTTNGPNDQNLKEIPSQVEVWTSNYLVPTLQFAEWRRRFSVGDKLVFLVNFSNPGIVQQKIRIEWLWDADAPPPTYLMQFSINPPYVYLNNGVYELQLVANPGYSDWIDWSISLHGNGYHVEYTLFGYDVHPISSGWWFPKKLPGGNWAVLPGPIRAVAYRENNITVVPPLKQNLTNELYHREIIIVPYGVKYFIYYANYEWLKDVKIDYRYLALIGQVSGTKNDTSSPYRMKYGGLQLSNGNYVTGNYTIYGISPWNVMHRVRYLTSQAGDFGYWVCQYGPYSGQALFLSQQTYDLLSKQYKQYSQVWAWSTYDWARRVID